MRPVSVTLTHSCSLVGNFAQGRALRTRNAGVRGKRAMVASRTWDGTGAVLLQEGGRI